MSPFPWKRSVVRGGVVVFDARDHTANCMNPGGGGYRAPDGSYCGNHTKEYGGHVVFESCQDSDLRRILAAIHATQHFTLEALELLCRTDTVQLPLLFSVLMDSRDGEQVSMPRKRILQMVELVVAARQVLEENEAKSTPGLLSLDRASQKLEMNI